MKIKSIICVSVNWHEKYIEFLENAALKIVFVCKMALLSCLSYARLDISGFRVKTVTLG